MTNPLTHLLLFILTLVSTTLAGAEWVTNTMLFSAQRPMLWAHFVEGFNFSVPFLGILTLHEFGHYYLAKRHGVSATLPYYLPLWVGFLGMYSIGTAGAFIRIKEPIETRRQYFDIGIAGPLAGFVVALVVLYYGFTHLPDPSYVFTLHPEYIPYGLNYAEKVYQGGGYLYLGNTLLFDFFSTNVARGTLPHVYEMMHYPLLLAGYLGLFFTALNLLPMGQLDGGHIVYALLGARWHAVVSRVVFGLLIMYGLLGAFQPADEAFVWQLIGYGAVLFFVLRREVPALRLRLLGVLGILAVQVLFATFFPNWVGYRGWFVFACIVGGILGLTHPSTYQINDLSWGRKVLGIAALAIFVLCFSWMPFGFAT